MVLLCASGVVARQRPPGAVDQTAPDGLKLKATFFPTAAPGPGVLPQISKPNVAQLQATWTYPDGDTDFNPLPVGDAYALPR